MGRNSQRQLGGDPDGHAGLIEAVAASRDRDAFLGLFSYYAPRLKSYFMRLGCRAELAEELCQEVMIALWRHAGSFERGHSSVSAWVYRIARNRHIDHLRKNGGRSLDPNDPLLRPDPPEQPDDAAAAMDRQARVRRALDDLPEAQSRLLHLAFFEGKSHSEIAEALALPLGTVKSRLRHAYGRLREAVYDLR